MSTKRKITKKKTTKKIQPKKKENLFMEAIKQPYYWAKALVTPFFTSTKGFLFGKDGDSIKKDWWIAGILAIGFFAVIKGVVWLSESFGLTEAFNMVDFYVVAAKAAFVSALAWSLIKYVFAGTLGKDFGVVFDKGWKSMPSVEKTRWIIGVFIAIFVALIFAF